MAEGERILLGGMLSPTTTFRILTVGEIGRLEIERLIQKLQFDLEILYNDEAQRPPAPSVSLPEHVPTVESALASYQAVVDKLAAPTAEPPAKKPRQQTSNSPVNAPHGFYNIMDFAEKLVEGRRRIAADTGATAGYVFNGALSAWYKENGYSDIYSSMRTSLAQIGAERDMIRSWYFSLPAGQRLSDSCSIHQLLAAWERYKKTNKEASKPKPEPALRKKDPVDLSVTPVFRSTGKIIELMPTGEVILASKAAATVEKPSNSGSYVFKSFAEVDTGALDAYDERVLRRFTENLTKSVNPNEAANKQIAGVIRDIRGKEDGDTPLCAQRLAALGVFSGNSGDYKLRREYLESGYLKLVQFKKYAVA